MPPAKGILPMGAMDLGNDDLSVRPADNSKFNKFDLTEYMDLDEFLLVTNHSDSGSSLDVDPGSCAAHLEKKPSAEFLASLLAGIKHSESSISNSSPTMGLVRSDRLTSSASSTTICSSSDDEDVSMLTSRESEQFQQPEKKVVKRRKPRTYKYNPKPLQHKINRAFVPDAMKDDEYWERRRKNNQAAKKSREERRKKELEVLSRMEKLVQENNSLIAKLKKAELKNEQLEKQLEELRKSNCDKLGE